MGKLMATNAELSKIKESIILNAWLSDREREIMENAIKFVCDSPKILNEFWQRSSDACPLTDGPDDDEIYKFKIFVQGKISMI